MSVKVELVKIRTTFELRGGRPSKFPAKILSTVASSRGILSLGARVDQEGEEMLLVLPGFSWILEMKS